MDLVTLRNTLAVRWDAGIAAFRRMRPSTLVFLVLTLVFVLVGYGLLGHTEELDSGRRSALGWMIRRWDGSGGDLSHGWLIPLVSLVVVYKIWPDLRAAPKQRAPIALLFLFFAALLLPLGMRVQQTRFSLVSLIGVIWAVPWFLWGWGIARRIVFPVGYLLFCIPLSFLDVITFRLRLLTTMVSAWVVSGLGIPVMRRGTAIIAGADGNIQLDVADPCSGLRSLLALTALTAVYAYFSQRTLLRKWCLFACSVPIAMSANVLRVVLICLVAMSVGVETAIGIYHDYSGYVVFLAGVFLTVAAGKIIDRIGRRKEQSV